MGKFPASGSPFGFPFSTSNKTTNSYRFEIILLILFFLLITEVTITRIAITTEEDLAKKSTEMGRKMIVPYALYRVEGYVSANLARKTTGFSEDDLELLWEYPL